MEAEKAIVRIPSVELRLQSNNEREEKEQNKRKARSERFKDK